MATENFEDALTWLRIERDAHQGDKWDYEKDKEWSLERWEEQIGMYIKRAEVLTLDNPLGRQAIAKAAATAVAMFEVLFAVYHWVPTPGVPSGELKGDFPKQDEVVHECARCGRNLHGYKGPLCRYCDPNADSE
jgi:hypothetical protein